jgi:stress response protein SCP2
MAFPFTDRAQKLTINWPGRGEKTAQALEANLTSLEKKIDDLLASVEKTGRQEPDDASRARPGVLDVAGKS